MYDNDSGRNYSVSAPVVFSSGHPYAKPVRLHPVSPFFPVGTKSAGITCLRLTVGRLVASATAWEWGRERHGLDGKQFDVECERALE